MGWQNPPTFGWVDRRREPKRPKREKLGDSPERAAKRGGQRGDIVDKWLSMGGVDRKGRFKKK